MPNDPQHLSLTLPPDLQGERLDKALSTLYPDLSRAQWQRLMADEMVRLNDDTAVKPNQKVRGGEIITATLPPTSETNLIAEDIALDILYEDDDLLAINKPAGMVVHPAVGNETGTLVHAVLHHCPDVLDVGGERRPGIVHRLDKETSGVILVAKHDRALNYLQAQFKERTTQKTYLALVEGQIKPERALIDAPIGRDPKQRKLMAVIPEGRRSSATSRPAQTRYDTAVAYPHHTLVQCSPLTGRTHQIRVHLAYIGHPIVGDTVYGRRKPTLPLNRHFLHAASLTFRRPSDEQELTINAPLPPELQQLLNQLDETL
jgi:23S rRNA pseudouridine1911/1915/1917 synthase